MSNDKKIKLVVCVKQVPASMDDITVTEDEKIDEEYLVFDLNEYDKYALEEAVQTKEKYGGIVIVVSIGPERVEETLRVCLAKGADKAIRVYDDAIEGSDTYVKAKILAHVIKDLDPDLVFTGLQSDDEAHAQFGVALANKMSLPHASLVIGMNYDPYSKKAIVERELEGGLKEKVEIKTPAVLTVQTGINEPRYASIMKIRKFRDKEIDLRTLNHLNIDKLEVGYEGSLTRVEKIYKLPTGEMAEILKGSPEEVARQLVEILANEGLLVS